MPPIARTMAATIVAFAAGVALPAHAQSPVRESYPARPVRVIVSYAAGNVTDILARLVADRLAERWGQQVLVDNRPGAGGSTGAQAAVKAAPDGYTLLFSAMAAMAINPHVYANVGYDPLADFAPIVPVAMPSSLLFVTPALPVESFRALVDYTKANPGKVFYGSAGNGTVPHLNVEMLKRDAGLVVDHVPYKGAVAAMTDVMAGRLQLQAESLGVVLPHVKAGKLKAIAVMGPRRLAALPDVPTIGEAVPGFDPAVPWLALFAPKGTPADVITKVHTDVIAVMGTAAFRERLDAAGLEPVGGSTAEFRKRLDTDHARFGRLVRELKLKAD
jgi:tripartite-type tricarboxylate transporter receptor subunit TctC